MDGSDRTAEARRPQESGGAPVSHAAAPAQPGPIVLARETPFRLGTLSVEPPLRRVAHDDGREEILEPRVMQVLVALHRAGGAIVTRDELTMSCWRGVVVGEDALARVIGRLRRLAEGVGAGVFEIETITKVGYRLAGAGLAAANPAPPAPTLAAGPSICVLPFANMSDDPQQEYFSDGISEDIITDLSRVSTLFVVARTTSFSFRNTTLDAQQIARQLGVGHLLEGSVRKADGRVRVTAQLIDGATGGHLWAERFDRDLKDIFALQDEVSRSIVGALKVRLLPEEQKAIGRRGTTNLEAYNLYLQARRYYVSAREGDRRSLDAIERLAQRAAEIDPGYARAWELLAFAQTVLHFNYGRPGDVGLAAAERALALDSSLAEACAIKARHLMQDGADKDDASRLIERALRLEPDSWAANSEAGRLNYGLGRYAEAIGYFEKATALGVTSAGDPGMMMSSYNALGDSVGARRAAQITLGRAEEALLRGHVNGAAMGCVVGALAVLGQSDRARDIMDRAMLIDPDNMNMRYNFACGASSMLHDADAALQLLEPVFATVSAGLLDHARGDPDLDPLRDDPRFQAMFAAAEARLARDAELQREPKPSTAA